MERVRNRKTHVALLLGHLELHLETSSTRQVPNSGAGDGHKGAVTDRGDCQAAAGGSERVAHHHCGCRVSLTATRTRLLLLPLKLLYSIPPRDRALACLAKPLNTFRSTHRLTLHQPAPASGPDSFGE